MSSTACNEPRGVKNKIKFKKEEKKAQGMVGWLASIPGAAGFLDGRCCLWPRLAGTAAFRGDRRRPGARKFAADARKKGSAEGSCRRQRALPPRGCSGPADAPPPSPGQGRDGPGEASLGPGGAGCRQKAAPPAPGGESRGRRPTPRFFPLLSPPHPPVWRCC